MKKLAIAAAAVALVGASFAEGITSANIVGYNTTESMTAGQWYILGLSFENVGDTTTYKIKDLLAADKFISGALVAGTGPSSSTQIQIRDASGKAVTYYYSSEADFDWGTMEPIPGWIKQGGLEITEDTLAAGAGFWFRQPTGGGAVTLNFAGQVKAASSAEITFKSTWALAANPYPKALVIKDLASADLTAGTGPSSSTQIQIRDASGKAVTYYYSSEADFDWGTMEPIPGWIKQGGLEITEDTIGVGVGFWVKDPTKTFSITVSK